MANREQLVSHVRQEATSFMRELSVMQRIIDVWNVLDYSTGLTQEDLGARNQDITIDDLANLVAALTAINNTLNASSNAARKAFYKIMTQVDP